MSQPHDDDFYRAPTEITELPPREGSSQQDLSEMSTIEQLDFPPFPSGNQPERPQALPPQVAFGPAPQRVSQQPPLNQPGPGAQRPPDAAPPQAQRALNQPNPEQPRPPLNPASQPGFEQVGATGPMHQRGLSPQNFASQRPDEQGRNEPEQLHFPPPSGPISQPGFSSAEPARASYNASQNDTQSVYYSQSDGTVPAWEPAPDARPQEPAAQQSTIPAWQLPTSESNSKIADWPTIVQPPTATRPQRPRFILMIVLVGLALLIIASGTFVLISQKNKQTPPVSQSTATANHPTSIATHSAGTPAHTPVTSTGGLNGMNVPVQAGTDWLATITSARTTRSSLIPPNAGQTYLELHLTLKNTSAKTLTVISILEFTLTDASGHRYNEIATDTNVRRTPDGNVNPQQTLNAQLAYEVPTTQHSFILTFAYGLSHNTNESVSWGITV